MDIEKGKGLPKTPVHRGGSKAKYPFEQCEVGDSFFIPHKKHEDISGSISWWNNKLHPAVFKPSLYDEDGDREEKDGVEGIRVHRIK